MSYDGLKAQAMQWDAVQQTRLRLNNMFKAFDRMGHPYPPEALDWLKGVESTEDRLQDAAVTFAQTGEPWLQAVAEHVTGRRGLGPAVLCVLGLIPPLTDFANPAKLWAYLGLAVDGDGKAYRAPLPPPPNNTRGPKGSHFSRRLRAYATERIVAPIIRDMDSADRHLYDERRVRTAKTHPEWALERNKAGKLTPNGHYHRDAIRWVAKRVWRNIWRVAHGGQDAPDTQSSCAAVGDRYDYEGAEYSV